MIIGISGRMRSGKDTIGQMLMCCAEVDFIELKHKKFASPVKAITTMLTGIPMQDLEKEEIKNSFLPHEWDDPNLVRLVGNCDDARMTVREMLQKIGTDCIRNNLHTNAWVNAMMHNYKKIYQTLSGYPDWIITDVRFPNEFDAIKEHDGFLIRVNRNLPKDDVHISEVALDKEKRWDYVIENDGTLEELNEKVREIWTHIKTVRLMQTAGSPQSS